MYVAPSLLVGYGYVQASLLCLVPDVTPPLFPQFINGFSEQIFHLRGIVFLVSHLFVPPVGQVECRGTTMCGVGHGIAVHFHEAIHVSLCT
jgi:hypothetical protein